MTDSRLDRFLSRFVDLRPGESRTTLLLFLFFFLMTFPAYVIKPLKLSLFFVNFHPRFQPFAYLLSALLIGFVAALNYRLLRKLDRRRYFSRTILFFISGFLLFWVLWVLLRIEWKALSLVYWIWSDVFFATSVTQFWICVNDAFHPHQAKRLIGFFVTGGLMGGIGGSLLAWRLAGVIGTENLLLICPAILALSLIVANALYKAGPVKDDGASADRSGSRDAAGYLESLRLILGNRYLLLLAGFLCAGSIAGNLIEFQFNTIVSWRFINKDPRTAFLGSFYAALLVISFFIQLFGTGRILKRFGMRVGLAVTPIVLCAGSAVIFLIPTAYLIYWAVLVRGADKILENTLNQSVREILYIPVPSDVKAKAKMFIDMFLNKFSTAVGALIFLLFYTMLHVGIERISLLVIPFLVLWVVLIRIIFKEYLNSVKKDLERKWEDGEQVVAQHVDVDAARLVFDTIESRGKSSVLYAMNIFDLMRKDKLTPELKRILDDKSGELRARSMDALLDAGSEIAFRDMEDALSDEEFTGQVKEVLELEVYKKLIEEQLERSGQDRMDETGRMEAAKVIGLMRPSSWAVRQLGRLLGDDSPDVINYALSSAAGLKRRELLPLIVRQLGNPIARQEARNALAAYGGRILGFLNERLADEKEDISVRTAIPEILARLGTQKTADALLAELAAGRREEIEKAVIEALYRIKAGKPGITFKEARVIPAAAARIRKVYVALLNGESEERLTQAVKPIFDLLSLIRPTEDIVKAYQNICQGTRKSIDYSLELLDNIVPQSLMEYLYPLIESLPPEERIRRCRKLCAGLDKLSRRFHLERNERPPLE